MTVQRDILWGMGNRQRSVLRCLMEWKGWYDKNDLRFNGWSWEGFASTRGIILSLKKRGLVKTTEEEFKGWAGKITKYVLTEKGVEAAEEALKCAGEDLTRR